MRRILMLSIVLTLALTLAVPAMAQSAIVHVVQPGENLFRIARHYGVTVDALAAANNLSNASRIYAGQRLTIPTGGNTTSPNTPSSGVHVVRAGENLFRIALRYGTTAQVLAAANGIRNPSFIYVGQALRIPSSGRPAPSAPSPGRSGRWIDVNLGAQRLTAYEGNTPVRSTLISTGLPRTPTPTGRYRIYAKYVSTLMSGPGYYLPNVPYAMYFYRNYSLHGTYWHNSFGRPMSHGCINMPTSEAQWIYNWASIGTPVNIH